MKFPEQFRSSPRNSVMQSDVNDPFGLFEIPGRNGCGRRLRVIACDGDETGWEHVSVSLPDSPTRCPSWDEMCVIKGLFWEEEECVVQFHPPKKEYVNNHAGCLHLWRHVNGFPQPPSILVGI